MKNTLTILLFLVSFSVVAQTTSTKVYTTTTGTKYHKSSCRHLAKSKIETTLAKAKAAKYTACKVCKPSGAIATKQVKKVSTGSKCTATTQKGSRCKRNAASGSKTCWQH